MPIKSTILGLWPDYETCIAVYKLSFGGGLNAEQVRAWGERIEVARLDQLPRSAAEADDKDHDDAVAETVESVAIPADMLAEFDEELAREAAGDHQEEDLSLEPDPSDELAEIDAESETDIEDSDTRDNHDDDAGYAASSQQPLASTLLSSEELDLKAALWKKAAMDSLPALDVLRTGRDQQLHKSNLSLVAASVSWYRFLSPSCPAALQCSMQSLVH